MVIGRQRRCDRGGLGRGGTALIGDVLPPPLLRRRHLGALAWASSTLTWRGGHRPRPRRRAGASSVPSGVLEGVHWPTASTRRSPRKRTPRGLSDIWFLLVGGAGSYGAHPGQHRCFRPTDILSFCLPPRQYWKSARARLKVAGPPPPPPSIATAKGSVRRLASARVPNAASVADLADATLAYGADPSARYVAMVNLPTALVETLANASTEGTPPGMQITFGGIGEGEKQGTLRVGDASYSFTSQPEALGSLRRGRRRLPPLRRRRATSGPPGPRECERCASSSLARRQAEKSATRAP